MTRHGVWLVVVALGLASFAQADAPCTALRWFPDTLKTVYDPGRGFYCYAPSVLIDERSVEHVFACRNREARVMRDHIVHFTRNGDATPVPQIVLSPGSAGAWDSYHVCDPTVIAGEFRLNGKLHRYAMFYLGNNVNGSRDNQIGVALADDLDRPWERVGENPIIANPVAGAWGLGQASAVSVDHKGRLLLFYTWGVYGTTGHVREVDLSDANKPIVGEPVTLPTVGLTTTDGSPDWLSNFDIVLDESRDRFLIVREQRPGASLAPRFIAPSLQVASVGRVELLKRQGTWTAEGSITPQMTGFARNHNAGFVRTIYGALPESSRVRVMFASSKQEPELKGLFAPWTYALHEIAGVLPP